MAFAHGDLHRVMTTYFSNGCSNPQFHEHHNETLHSSTPLSTAILLNLNPKLYFNVVLIHIYIITNWDWSTFNMYVICLFPPIKGPMMDFFPIELRLLIADL